MTTFNNPHNTWNQRFDTAQYIFGEAPNAYLQRQARHLQMGAALAVADGEGRNGVWLAEQGLSVDAFDFSENAIQKARNFNKADLVIPVMHWGWENELTANDRQRQLARVMIDAGADAVIGGHPHVTQDIEHYQGKPIVYSVGNFVMKETDNDNQRRGWVLRLTLDKPGVRAFDTRVARIRFEGIPQLDRSTASPCWARGDSSARLCHVE